MNKIRLSLILVLALSTVSAWGQPAQSNAPAQAFPQVTDRMLQNPDPGDWLMWRRTLNSWGHSPLNQINKSNVANMRMVWTRTLGPGVQEGTPLVYRGTMYFPNPSDLVQAFNGATGDMLWEYRRQHPEDLGKHIPFPSINRNLAIYGDKIIDTSADDFVFALDASSGKLAWETRIQDYRELSAQETSGPIIANGKIISGRGCEPKAAADACVIVAHDAKSGKELWRTRTIPRDGEPGSETWGNVAPELKRHVGTWMVPSWDPELNLIYIGTSVTSPAPKFMTGGNDLKYLYHNCTLAINADTGKIVWYYQHVVDHWDLDHPFERLLVDTAVTPDASQVTWINPKIRPGERRKVITGIPGKTGIVYTLDRATGEFLWARATVFQNVVSKIDGATGAVTDNPASVFTKPGEEKLICPNMNGGKNWQAGAYNPQNNLMFMPLQNSCALMAAISDKPQANSLYGVTSKAQIAPNTQNVGTIFAISAETGKTVWKYEQRAGTMSLLSTAGGLLFGGDVNGRFRAWDQETGKILWEVNIGSAVTGYPIAYNVNGKEYIAVSTGNSLAGGGTVRLTPELKPSNGSQLFVFALP